ncbi:1,4-alpha-glucan branching protein GlgB [Lactiplantibacillus fabifermentans]|uniref:1,4-alpha-glucan branching enzyme GlgB n=1 Tax=Lactiplantibacillus fabifermentans T30PCM01 TaxID=1400520 RepID=W6TBC8_9LACO|nr:1,4-alpha-glucan branching protein GlgB [Lactiplantibacillus fabifermentans]ETY75773.1 glycogen-branching protein [Lactiplantibacillus fabifermentans T30PCM01]
MVNSPQQLTTQAYLFNTGQGFASQDYFGCHFVDATHVTFRVWAPQAKAVAVVGSFNDWQATPLTLDCSTGIWAGTLTTVQAGDLYKFQVTSQTGDVQLKIDPFAQEFERKPGDAAVVLAEQPMHWHDSLWLARRHKSKPQNRPINIYEVHLGSWRRHADDSYYTYAELADELIPYVKGLGYTHIELMPVMEHLLDASWGYQQLGYFAPTSRFGHHADFLKFVDRCHQANLGVIVDWVPGHFIRNYDALYQYDGTPTFEYADEDRANNRRWGAWNFDLGKTQVQSFLISSALYWLSTCHLDGLRVDAVSNMLYLDYDEGREGQVNQYGDNRNLEGIAFLQKLNTEVFAHHPDILMIAEESSSYPQVTGMVADGGLGFNYKWNMGWMHDTLDFFEMDPLYRCDHFNLLTFAFVYMFDEQFILPFSHDEVVHGKKSLMHKMPGDRYNQFANLRTMMTYMAAFPGKQLNFMGSEWGQYLEWRDWSQLEWVDLDDAMNAHMQQFTTALNTVYHAKRPLWELDHEAAGIKYTYTDDPASSTMVFIRQAKRKYSFVIAAFNFVPVERRQYRIGVPYPGTYELLLNTEDQTYGGTWTKLETTFTATDQPFHGQPASFEVTLPAMGALLIQPHKVKGESKK